MKKNRWISFGKMKWRTIFRFSWKILVGFLLGKWTDGKFLCFHEKKSECQNLRFSYFSFGLIFKRISSQKKRLTVPKPSPASLARTVPKPSPASLARTVPKPSQASLARTVSKPSRFRAGALKPLVVSERRTSKRRQCLVATINFRYRPPTLLVVSEVKVKVKVKWKWKWSEVKVKVKVKWLQIGPLFFLKLIYIIYHVYTYNPVCIKMCSQLSYGFKSLQTFGEPTKKNWNHKF